MTSHNTAFLAWARERNCKGKEKHAKKKERKREREKGNPFFAHSSILV
jgi:hypothetical protein